MNNQEKAIMYDRFMSEYYNLDKQIGQIKMNKMDLNPVEQSQVNLLEKKKVYIMSRIQQLQSW